MKKILSLLVLLVCSFGVISAQSKQLEKQRSKMYKAKIKEYKKEGWKLDSSSKTIEVALLEHYEKMKDDNYQEIIGTTSNCLSTNVCRQVAYNNAIITYASLSASQLKGRTASDIYLDASDTSSNTEFDKFYAAYERIINTEIKDNTIVESYCLKRKRGNANEYQIIFLINEDKALNARKRAMQRAVDETHLAQEYAAKVSKFINEGVSTAN